MSIFQETMTINSFMKSKVLILDTRHLLYSLLHVMSKVLILITISNQILIKTGLTVIPVVIVSNQTVHERNIAFSCNVLLIDFIKNHFPRVEKVHFWSDGCSSQFRLQYVFRSFSYFPRNLELTWNYGEAHHFKGPHDGIGGAIKRKVFSDVTTQKVVIQNASHFCSYASNVSHVNMIYLDKSEVQIPDVNDSSYVPGTLKVHQVKRVDENTVEFYYNSQYKKVLRYYLK